MQPEPTDDDLQEFANSTHLTVERVRRVLAGLRPDVQGCVIAELVAIYLAGYPRQARDEVLESLIVAPAKAFVRTYELELYGEAGHPSNDGRG